MAYPKDFLWGAATSSHQVEGNNRNNDWWQWEEAGKTATPSGTAADHYNRYEEDFDILTHIGHNAHRLSIEWSRVETDDGVFNTEAIDHYRRVLNSLKRRSISPIVTLHHFTIPLWLQQKGGWLNSGTSSYFTRYVKRIVTELGDYVHFWITINEPMVYGLYSYCLGIWPPGSKSQLKGFCVVNNMVRAHKSAYKEIHDMYRFKKWAKPMVGFAKNYRPFLVCPKTPNFFCKLGTWWKNLYFNKYYLHRVRSKIDFIGVNYYELEYDSNDRSHKLGLLGGNCTHPHKHFDHINQLGWVFSPKGLGLVLDWLVKFKKPIMITENGTCEVDDEWRKQYIMDHIDQVDQAVQKGYPIIGYLYWSLLDNFEWHQGLDIRFGLVDINYQTLERTIRPSALHYHNMIVERKIRVN